MRHTLILILAFLAFPALGKPRDRNKPALPDCRFEAFDPAGEQSRAEKTAAMAKQAGLHVWKPNSPSYTRKVVGSRTVRGKRVKVFGYFDEAGKQLAGKKLADLLQRLKDNKHTIPPNWSEVKITIDPLAHVQIRGRDDQGRSQELRHPEWTRVSNLHKFDLNIHFGTVLSQIRKSALSDLQETEPTKRKALAALLLLMDATQIRVGNESSAKDGKFGLTTLEKKHFKLDGDTIQFDFHGKHDVKNESERDLRPELTAALRDLRRLPGDRLFQYRDPQGRLRQLTADDFNSYLGLVSGNGFTAKNFRTWWATRMALEYLTYEPFPKTEKEKKAVWKEAVDGAAGFLNNNPSEAERSYIDPIVKEVYFNNPEAVFAAFDRRPGRLPSEVESGEVATLRFLQEQRARLGVSEIDD
ncbi:hypothetical protein K2X33_02410 [bacterium]|nr:hypothetical protein [bacterium]